MLVVVLQISKEGNLIEHFSTSYFFPLLVDTCEEKTFYNRLNVCIKTIYGYEIYYLNIWHEDLIHFLLLYFVDYKFRIIKI